MELQKFTVKIQKYRLKTGVSCGFSLFFQPSEKSSRKVPIFGKIWPKNMGHKNHKNSKHWKM